MLKAIPDDLTITDVMIKQMEELPDPSNDYSKIMMNLASIPAEVVSMAIRQEEAVDFAKNYPDQVNKNPQADSSIILEEALTNYPDLKAGMNAGVIYHTQLQELQIREVLPLFFPWLPVI